MRTGGGNLRSLSTYYIKSLFPSACLILAIILFYALAIAPRAEEMESIKAEFELVSQEIEKAQNIILSIPEMKEEIELLKQKHAALLLKIPDDIEIPGIVSKISAVSTMPGVRMVSLSPGKENDRAAVEINIRADFFSLGKLVEQIESSSMPLSISEFRVTGTPTRDELDVRMVISSFFREKHYD